VQAGVTVDVGDPGRPAAPVRATIVDFDVDRIGLAAQLDATRGQSVVQQEGTAALGVDGTPVVEAEGTGSWATGEVRISQPSSSSGKSDVTRVMSPPNPLCI